MLNHFSYIIALSAFNIQLKIKKYIHHSIQNLCFFIRFCQYLFYGEKYIHRITVLKTALMIRISFSLNVFIRCSPAHCFFHSNQLKNKRESVTCRPSHFLLHTFITCCWCSSRVGPHHFLSQNYNQLFSTSQTDRKEYEQFSEINILQSQNSYQLQDRITPVILL